MFNAASLICLRQLFSRTLTNLFPAKRIPNDLTGALKAAAEGKIALNPPVPTWGRFRGKVSYDRAKCIGCGMCFKMCP
ncbi:MAG: 4Fe-4S binding protein, partial [Pyramidobacter sp.]|nr:4Fe-4S binding protein [Pyramidobacter sp.]